MAKTRLERATRLAKIARSIPQTWTDSANWPEDDLKAVAGLISARYRVNGDSPLDRVYIVETINAALSFEVLESWGIKDARSFFLIAVRSGWGAHFPDVLDEEQGARIVGLAENPAECGGTIEAVFRHGKNERDDKPFVFRDWTGHSPQEARKPDANGHAEEWLLPRSVTALVQETGCSQTTINDDVKNGSIPGGAFRENNKPRGAVILKQTGLDYLKRKGGKDK